MNRSAVTSSSILEIGYDVRTRTLELQFVNRHVYQYSHVPSSEYNALMAAQSRGTFVNQRIKGKYSCNRTE